MKSIFKIILILLFSGKIFSQISPGELANAHKELEGINNCTKCHTLGKELSNKNCLSCHKEISSRLKLKKGFHFTVAKKECVECHKDHHGRNFEIIHFDKKEFNHSQVGFNLENKHATIKCEECHSPQKIKSPEILALNKERKTRTFLGLNGDCVNCHEDVHKKQFSKKCNDCHNTKNWKPAENFLHAKAKFQLIGKHEKVECEKCHKKTWAKNSVTQFIKLEFSSCDKCHNDIHKGKFKQPCSECHTPSSWGEVKGKAFNHSMTKFLLKGKHTNLRCDDCHAKNEKEKNASGELGFKITKFSECKDCHNDAHAKQFNKRSDKGKCESCHNENGFAQSTYTFVNHQNSKFKLLGSHIATPCIKCHENNKVESKCTKKFNWGENILCITCHDDVHKNQFKEKFNNNCELCHTTESWQKSIFQHEKTKFILRAKHSQIKCAECHRPNEISEIILYSSVKKECNDCHEDKHAGQFLVLGKIKCESCHSDKFWKPVEFNHTTQSRYELTGKHNKLACNECHKIGTINEKITTIYKPLKSACIDCHPT